MKLLRGHCTLCGAVLLLLTAGLVGCGGGEDVETGDVTGIVTLDEQPLEGAVVTFMPEKGRPAYGRTDAEGRYTLQYTRDQTGALIGKNTVSISTERLGDPDAEDPALQKSAKETIPASYNVDSELTAQVESGSNTFNFDLKSEGEVVSQAELQGVTLEEQAAE